MKIKNLVYLSVFIFTFCACQPSSVKDNAELEKVESNVDPVVVSVYAITKGDFKQQLISNGKITANQQAVLRFQTSAILKKLNIKNGQNVKKGDTLAFLENRQNRINLKQSENTITKATIDLLDELLMAGFKNFEDTTNVTKNALDQYKIKSGFNQAILNNEKVQLDFNFTYLIAPFSGVIANLDKQVFDLINTNEEFCTLYNNQNLAVDFKLMEVEIKNIYQGQEVILNPFNNSDVELKANVMEINPMVDENGLIKIKAKIKTTNKQQLFAGFNLKVIIEHSIPNQFIIPKEAVVLRSNKKVIFCYKNGLAKWIYIDVLHENINSYAISGDIKPSDQVIVSNNLNLAHDAKVKLIDE